MSRTRRILDEGVSFVATMVLWLVVTMVVYGSFVLAWPETPTVNPWVHLGVFLFPFAGYVGHVAKRVRD